MPLDIEKSKESDEDSSGSNMSTEKETTDNVQAAEGTSLVTPTKSSLALNFRPSSLRRSLNILKRTGTADQFKFSPTATSSTNGTTSAAAATSSSPSLRSGGGLSFKRIGVTSYSPGRGSACLQAVKAKQDEKIKETIQQFEADMIVIDTSNQDSDTPRSILKNKCNVLKLEMFAVYLLILYLSAFCNLTDSSKKRVLFAEPVVSKKLLFDANFASLSTSVQAGLCEMVTEKENNDIDSNKTEQLNKQCGELVKKSLTTIITPVRQFSVDEGGNLENGFLHPDTEEDEDIESDEENVGNKMDKSNLASLQEEIIDSKPEKEIVETVDNADELPKDETLSTEAKDLSVSFCLLFASSIFHKHVLYFRNLVWS